jgi:hypothetical protein
VEISSGRDLFLKKDDKYNPSNYRPISLLNCVGKVMERVVYKYILKPYY